MTAIKVKKLKGFWIHSVRKSSPFIIYQTNYTNKGGLHLRSYNTNHQLIASLVFYLRPASKSQNLGLSCNFLSGIHTVVCPDGNGNTMFSVFENDKFIKLQARSQTKVSLLCLDIGRHSFHISKQIQRVMGQNSQEVDPKTFHLHWAECCIETRS